MMIGHISDTHLGAFIGRSEELREVAEDVHGPSERRSTSSSGTTSTS